MSGRGQFALPFTHAPAYAAEDLLPAPSNEAAMAWLARTGEWPGGRLALWGAAGSGKTHLLHVWAGRMGARLVAGRPLVFAPPEGHLAIDDADRAEERALLHTLNAAAEAGFAVLLAARTPPARWATVLPDLASRLRAVTAVEIGEADDDLLRRLLARLLSERQLKIDERLQDWLRLRLPRNAASMRAAAAGIEALVAQRGGGLTRAALAEWLATLQGSDHEDFAQST